ncbi:glutathione S-transferase family protein [Marivita sp. XM-24bin2]|jgi:glutathione S-transferase|uniref:glutathione S-transferase family protein n=1 Tax=unclassified Marivita TaxID=2632480 RepID=UPI0025BCF668|nr:glutathione S-transferase family protein [Marivita sp. XM-24bin2]MCR9111502.1 glutathione S-transferase family protein [Paracoccaceae bacterium]
MSKRPKVYGYAASTYTRMALVGAEKKGLDYDFQPVASWDGYDKDPEYIGLHPFLKVPVLEHDKVRLTETIAILVYIDRAFEGPHLTPSDPLALAKMWEIISSTISYAWPYWVPVLATNRLFNPMADDAVDENLISSRLPEMCGAAELIGNYLTARSGGFDLADIVVARSLKYATETPEWHDIAKAAPRLAEWWESTKTRPTIAKHMPDTDWQQRTEDYASRKSNP